MKEEIKVGTIFILDTDTCPKILCTSKFLTDGSTWLYFRDWDKSLDVSSVFLSWTPTLKGLLNFLTFSNYLKVSIETEKLLQTSYPLEVQIKNEKIYI